MSYFNYKSHNIYYEERGTGTPLIMLHGNTASSAMFYDVADKYRDSFKVILIDFLGHGQSDRLAEFPADLWFDEAQQVVTFLKLKDYTKVNIIGCSGGALVAVNVALEAPWLVSKVIADSFEGETPLKEVTANIVKDRELSKENQNAKMFYRQMHGADWEKVVDNDTFAVVRHEKEIGRFFHKDLSELKADMLMTGSRQDEFVSSISPMYFETVYKDMLSKIGHGDIYLFEQGGHPAMLSNQNEFVSISKGFFLKK